MGKILCLGFTPNKCSQGVMEEGTGWVELIRACITQDCTWEFILLFSQLCWLAICLIKGLKIKETYIKILITALLFNSKKREKEI